jgi:hypothetical protein
MITLDYLNPMVVIIIKLRREWEAVCSPLTTIAMGKSDITIFGFLFPWRIRGASPTFKCGVSFARNVNNVFRLKVLDICCFHSPYRFCYFSSHENLGIGTQPTFAFYDLLIAFACKMAFSRKIHTMRCLM